MTITLQTYAQEILPNYRALTIKSDILKEWVKENAFINEKKLEIKAIQDEIKAYIEDNEAELVREISALKTDIGQAVKGMVRGTAYKAPEMKQYLAKRSKDKIGDVIEQAELYQQINEELA